MDSRLRVSFRAITPLYVGGANPNGGAEMRLPSIKGALRFWYRAIDIHYSDREERIFGSMRAGQASGLLRLSKNVVLADADLFAFGERLYRQYQRGGLRYLSYSLNMGSNQRKAIPDGTEFALELLLKPRTKAGDLELTILRQAWLASFWLLANLGGLGSRSRRGLGSISMYEWQPLSGDWPEVSKLPLPFSTGSVGEWRGIMAEGLRTIHSWFPCRLGGSAQHSILNDNSRLLILKDGTDTWHAALDRAGQLLREFRLRYEPDYHNVKAHIAFRDRLQVSGLQPAPLKFAPERVRFGLPLTFRFTSLPQSKSITFVGSDSIRTRMASPLWIRIVKINNRYHPVFLKMDAPYQTTVVDQKSKRETFATPSIDILTDFITRQIEPLALEVPVCP